MKRRKPEKESVLLMKGSAEHERLFRAFRDRGVAEWSDVDRSGHARAVRAEVFSVQHAGPKTLFVLRVLEPPDGREER